MNEKEQKNDELEKEFEWTEFYSEFANVLLKFSNDRKTLISRLQTCYKKIGVDFPKMDHDGIARDVDPFTVFGLFNKGNTKYNRNRIRILSAIKTEFEINSPVPNLFNGIPVLYNGKACFFAFSNDKRRGNNDINNDINNLWRMFELAIDVADGNEKLWKDFVDVWDKVIKQREVGWNLTMGLYWIRPQFFINLDRVNRDYISKHAALAAKINTVAPNVLSGKMLPKGREYVDICGVVHKAITEKQIESISDFSYNAWKTECADKRKDVSGARRYWWLTSDPSLWNMAEMPIGKEEYYTALNEKGNKRKEYSAFKNCRKGDLLVGYVGKQDRHVCAILECVQPLMENRLYFRKIENIPNPIKRDEIISYKKLGEMTPMKSPQGSLFKLTKEQFNDIYALIKEKNPDFEIGAYTKEKFLDEVFMSSDQYNELVGLLERKKNIILQGAPGVGKTFAAQRLAYSMIGSSKDKSRIEFVQFHQSYSYENFICGYKPTADGGFKLEKGVFLKFCEKAKAEKDPKKKYFFIIDEINRGNLSKIFGELLVLIECDKRGKDDYAVKLAYGDGEQDKRFCVPENLYLIGLMNTADRSLAMIDYALRRRFAFFTIEPALDNNDKFSKQLKPELKGLVDAVKELNKTIEDDPSLGRGFLIGHSYFCGENVGSAKEILDYEIAPMLKEYWFENPKKADEEIEKLSKKISA